MQMNTPSLIAMQLQPQKLLSCVKFSFITPYCLKSKKGLMLIAWGDDDGLTMNQFPAIPLINAIAPFWCFILH
jgi:hypothetical protein